LSLLPAQIPIPCQQDWRNEVQVTAHHCQWNQSGFQRTADVLLSSSLTVKQGNINTPELMLFTLIFLFIKFTHYSDLQKEHIFWTHLPSLN